MADPSAPAPSPKWEAIKALFTSNGFTILCTAIAGIATGWLVKPTPKVMPVALPDRPAVVACATPEQVDAVGKRLGVYAADFRALANSLSTRVDEVKVLVTPPTKAPSKIKADARPQKAAAQ